MRNLDGLMKLADVMPPSMVKARMREIEKQKEPSAESIGAVNEALDAANRFNNTITLPTKEEYGGVPGQDYDASFWTLDFPKTGLKSDVVPTDSVLRMGLGRKGFVHHSIGTITGYTGEDAEGRPHIRFTPRDAHFGPASLSHEVAHAQARDAAPGQPGVSDTDKRKLHDAYTFTQPGGGSYAGEGQNPKFQNYFESNLALRDAEEHAMNAEIRRGIWDNLSRRLGRDATYTEFKDHIDNMSPEDIQKTVSPYANGFRYLNPEVFGPGKLTPERTRALQRAWKEVAQNRRHMGAEKVAEDRRYRNFDGLIKIAFGTQTVGDFMNAWNANLNANPAIRQDAFGRINRAGLDVKQPASRIPYVLGGGIAGRAAAKYLGTNPFWKGVATIGGAMYGNHLYNKNHPDPGMQPIAPGLVRRGF